MILEEDDSAQETKYSPRPNKYASPRSNLKPHPHPTGRFVSSLRNPNSLRSHPATLQKPSYPKDPKEAILNQKRLHMASSRYLQRTVRSFCTAASTHQKNHQKTHNYLKPNTFIGSWNTPKDPKEAEKQLAQLRRDYARQVKEVRKEYIREVELMRLEKQRKDEARREALKAANAERKKLKAEAAKARAQERKVAEEEFRHALLKEKAEKLENWKMKETKREEKKKERNELLNRKSSVWIDEHELGGKILEVIVDTTPL